MVLHSPRLCAMEPNGALDSGGPRRPLKLLVGRVIEGAACACRSRRAGGWTSFLKITHQQGRGL